MRALTGYRLGGLGELADDDAGEVAGGFDRRFVFGREADAEAILDLDGEGHALERIERQVVAQVGRRAQRRQDLRREFEVLGGDLANSGECFGFAHFSGHRSLTARSPLPGAVSGDENTRS